MFELTPSLALHFIESASGNDYLYAAISGLAYCHPYRHLAAAMKDTQGVWDDYWRRSSCYMHRLGTNVTGVYTDAWKVFDRSAEDHVTAAIARACGQCEAMVLGMGRDEGRDINNANYELEGALVSHVLTRWLVRVCSVWCVV